MKSPRQSLPFGTLLALVFATLGSLPAQEPAVCGSNSYPLVAQINSPAPFAAGAMAVQHDGTNLTITLSGTEGWGFAYIRLWVGTDLALLPVVPSTGNPLTSAFPYQVVFDGALPPVTPLPASHTFTIPLAAVPTLNGQCDVPLYIAAMAKVWRYHADVNLWQHELVWSEGPRINVLHPEATPTYSIYTLACCPPPPPPPPTQMETAFAYGNWVFTGSAKSNPDKLGQLRLTNNRWGWAHLGGSYAAPIYAGAGLNRTDKATLVGTLNVVVSGGDVTVTYTMIPGASMEEAHVYVGETAPATVAPGQFGHTVYFNPLANSYTYTFCGADANGDGIVWVVAHAIAAF